MSSYWSVLPWAGITVLAGVLVVLVTPKHDRAEAARWFIGGTLCSSACFTLAYVLGWWTP